MTDVIPILGTAALLAVFFYIVMRPL